MLDLNKFSKDELENMKWEVEGAMQVAQSEDAYDRALFELCRINKALKEIQP